MFNAGDRVVCIVDHPDDNETLIAGYLGTVCRMLSSKPIGVRWDEDIDGHDCGGCCECGYGWFVGINEIEHYQECDDKLYTFDDQELNALLGIPQKGY